MTLNDVIWASRAVNYVNYRIIDGSLFKMGTYQCGDNNVEIKMDSDLPTHNI